MAVCHKTAWQWQAESAAPDSDGDGEAAGAGGPSRLNQGQLRDKVVRDVGPLLGEHGFEEYDPSLEEWRPDRVRFRLRGRDDTLSVLVRVKTQRARLVLESTDAYPESEAIGGEVGMRRMWHPWAVKNRATESWDEGRAAHILRQELTSEYLPFPELMEVLRDTLELFRLWLPRRPGA